jgi:hypothetical protein
MPAAKHCLADGHEVCHGMIPIADQLAESVYRRKKGKKKGRKMKRPYCRFEDIKACQESAYTPRRTLVQYVP